MKPRVLVTTADGRAAQVVVGGGIVRRPTLTPRR